MQGGWACWCVGGRGARVPGTPQRWGHTAALPVRGSRPAANLGAPCFDLVSQPLQLLDLLFQIRLELFLLVGVVRVVHLGGGQRAQGGTVGICTRGAGAGAVAAAHAGRAAVAINPANAPFPRCHQTPQCPPAARARPDERDALRMQRNPRTARSASQLHVLCTVRACAGRPGAQPHASSWPRARRERASARTRLLQGEQKPGNVPRRAPADLHPLQAAVNLLLQLALRRHGPLRPPGWGCAGSSRAGAASAGAHGLEAQAQRGGARERAAARVHGACCVLVKAGGNRRA